MEADQQAPVCESGDVFVEAPPELVWDTLTDLRSWPAWMPGVKSVTVADGPLRVGTTFRWKAGPGTIASEIVEAERGQSVAWKGRTFGIDAVHVWRIERQDGHSLVRTEESWSGLLPRALRTRMAKTVRQALDDGLSALKAEAERRARSAA